LPETELIACPQCDALYRVASIDKGLTAECARCHTVLAAPRRNAGLLISALALTTLILIAAALFFPFLTLETRGFRSNASLIDIALAFSGEELMVLVVLTLALMLALPALRAGLLIYTILPLVWDRPALPGAALAFKLAGRMKPWAMAEVFALGCAVALVKITDLAHVSPGQAFWMFAVLVGLVVLQDKFLCSWSVWNALSRKGKR
jgi:paraquat-inducible protein A